MNDMFFILPLIFTFTIDPPVIFNAKALPLLEGKKVSSISVYVYHSGEKTLIPFQIDEKDRKGEYLTRYVNKDGEFTLRKTGWKFGEFNGDDELIFMENDCGEKAPSQEMKKYVYEVEVKKKKPCYFYIAETPPNKGVISYVRYNPAEDFFKSDFFSYGSIGVSNHAILNFFKTENLPDSLLKRFHVNLSISTLWGKLKIKKTEEDIRVNIAGYTDGPVRVIKLMDHRMMISRGIESPRTRKVSVSSRRCGEFPTQINLPFKPSLIITDASLLLSFEFTYLANRFSIQLNDEIINIREIKGEQEIPFQNFVFLKSGETTIVASLKMEKELLKYASPTLLLKKDDNATFWISWKITKLENLKAGNYSFVFSLCTGDIENTTPTLHLHPLSTKDRESTQ